MFDKRSYVIAFIILNTLGQFVLYFVLYISVSAVLEYIKRLMFVVCKCNLSDKYRFVERLVFDMGMDDWIKMALMFIIFFMVVSVLMVIKEKGFKRENKFQTSKNIKYIASIVVSLFFILVHLMAWYMDIYVTGILPFKPELNILLAFVTSLIYKSSIDLFSK